jgi:hypothetical protein
MLIRVLWNIFSIIIMLAALIMTAVRAKRNSTIGTDKPSTAF